MSIAPVAAEQGGGPITRPVADPPRGPVRRARPPRARWMALAGLAVVLALTGLLPWEWSFIDDGALLTALHTQQQLHGAVAGIPADIFQMYRVDLTWGLFRPSYWVYAGTFYLLPVGLAHAVRLAMVVAALGGPLALIGRRYAGQTRVAVLTWAGTVLVANQSLFMGVWYPSLQELSGLAFVGLGLTTRRTRLRVVCWVVAAWFKAPFAWLLLAYGLLLCRRAGSRVTGAVTAAVGAGTLLAAVIFSRDGRYTAAMTFAANAVEHNVGMAFGLLGGPLAALVAGVFVLRPRFDLRDDPTAAALLLGGAGYVLNLLVWKTDGYYASPYVYLISAGILLAARDAAPVAARRLAAGLVVPVLIAGYFLAATAQAGRVNIRTVTGLRDCVLHLPDGVVVGYNRQEAWIRLDYIVREHRPQWRGRIALVGADETTGFARGGRVTHLDYFIYQPGYGAAAASLTSGPVVCHTPGATVYRVTS